MRIPVTVKMRAGWDATAINAPELARRVEDAGAAAVTVHGRTAAQSYTGFSDWDLIGSVAEQLSIPVFGSGDCIEPQQMIDRLRDTAVRGVLVGRGALRNPWIFEQAQALAAGRAPREVPAEERGRVPARLRRPAAPGTIGRGRGLPPRRAGSGGGRSLPQRAAASGG